MTEAGHPRPGRPLVWTQRADGGTSWRERALTVRDRLLGDPRFRRWAADMPFARWIARRRARELFDLTAGFVYSQVLLACVRLRLFEVLAEGPQTGSALASRLALSDEATERLLAAAVSLRLAAPRGRGRYGLGVVGATLVGNAAVLAMIEHHALVYRDMHDPVTLLRGTAGATELVGYWPYATTAVPAAIDPARAAAYTGLMAASQPLVAGDVLDAYPVRRHRCLLDVGGGDGTFLRAAAARAPGLGLMLFDLPPVAARARANLADAGLAARATIFAGNFLADPLPEGADVVALVRVLHDHDDDGALTLLRAVRRVLPRDGALLIAEPMAGTPGAEPMGDAYFGFYLLAMGRGRPRTAFALAQLARSAGFRRARPARTRMPLQCGLIVAQP